MAGQYFDLTVPIRSGMLHWPGDPEVELYRVNSFDKGDGVNISAVRFGLHTGTHMDAPLHFIDKADDITKAAPDIIIGKCRVINIEHPGFITAEELKNKNIEDCRRILFRTANSEKEWFRMDFNERYVYLRDDAAEYLVSLKIKLAGIDYLSIAEFRNGRKTHETLLGNDIWIIEGLYMKDIREGEYELFALPMKFEGADGSPVRVIIKSL